MTIRKHWTDSSVTCSRRLKVFLSAEFNAMQTSESKSWLQLIYSAIPLVFTNTVWVGASSELLRFQSIYRLQFHSRRKKTEKKGFFVSVIHVRHANAATWKLLCFCRHKSSVRNQTLLYRSTTLNFTDFLDSYSASGYQSCCSFTTTIRFFSREGKREMHTLCKICFVVQVWKHRNRCCW